MMYFDLIRFALLAAVIGYAAYQDVKCGEVKNKTWVYAPFGLSLTFTALCFDPQTATYALTSMTVMVVAALILFYVGGWGGADTKAFLAIAVAMPTVSFVSWSPFFMYPLKVLALSAFFALIVSAVLKKKQLRFLPYIFISLFVALLF